MLNSVYGEKKSDFGEGTRINAPSLKLVYINLFICSEAVACRLLELFFFPSICNTEPLISLYMQFFINRSH